MDTQGYGDWRAVEIAIKDATKEAAREACAGVSAATVDAQVRRAPTTTGACPACSPRVRLVSGCSQSA